MSLPGVMATAENMSDEFTCTASTGALIDRGVCGWAAGEAYLQHELAHAVKDYFGCRDPGEMVGSSLVPRSALYLSGGLYSCVRQRTAGM